MNRSMYTVLAIVLLASLLGITSAWATVTNVAWYRLGEDDSGATAGATGNAPTADLMGHNLGRHGSPLYSSDVPTANPPGSTLSMRFDSAHSPFDGYTGFARLVCTNLDNFGYEAYVKVTDTTGYQTIVHNSKIGLLINNGNWAALIDDVAWVNSAIQASETNVWVQLAMVRTNGVTTLYVNGAVRATSTATPNALSDTSALTIGCDADGTRLNNNLIDEVRVFTFESGQFNPATDLTYPAPPSSPVRASSSTVKAYFRLGENDPGTVAGATGNAVTLDSSTNELSLTRRGLAAYSSDVPPANSQGSTLSMLFDASHSPNDDYYVSTAAGGTNLDNICIEAYVKLPDMTAANRVIVHNGNMFANGMSLYVLSGSTWTFGLSAVVNISSPIDLSETNVWVHVAGVRENGVSVLYVNGGPRALSTSTPNPVSAYFGIGRATANGAWPFNGWIDEVRVFTFTGTFNSVIDLAYPPPPPRGTVVIIR
ncbi:MAG: LamG domain-containing protein [Lentisphaerae bacterium]|nr:LamG domain-containing protein [Lentisphaerota bacterium]